MFQSTSMVTCERKEELWMCLRGKHKVNSKVIVYFLTWIMAIWMFILVQLFKLNIYILQTFLYTWHVSQDQI